MAWNELRNDIYTKKLEFDHLESSEHEHFIRKGSILQRLWSPATNIIFQINFMRIFRSKTRDNIQANSADQ